MRALLCVKPGELAVIERPRPSPRQGEVLVRIRRAGVCGTDLHIFEGSHPFLEYPRVIGHELSGEVEETGPGCSIAVGQKVFVIPYLSCGSCVACRRGKTNCCQRIAVLGVHIDGGMADYICVPEGNVASADEITLDQAAMVEFLAIGAHAVRRANPRKGDRILVVGAGPIGLGCMIFARLRGGSVTALDMRQDRLDFCRKALAADNIVVAGSRHGRGAFQAHRRRSVRHRHRRDRQSRLDGDRVRLCRPWRHLRAGQRRARHHLVLGPEFPRPRDFAARKPQCNPRRLRRRLSGHARRNSCRQERSPLIARRSNSRRLAFRIGSSRKLA